MAMTTTPTIPIPQAHPGSWLRRRLVWVLVAVAMAASAVVLVAALAGDSSTTDSVRTSLTGAEHELSGKARLDSMGAVDNPMLDRSIAAIDHAQQTGGGAVLDRSISAIDHATGRAPATCSPDIGLSTRPPC